MMHSTVLICTTITLEREGMLIPWLYIQNEENTNIFQDTDLYTRVCLVTVSIYVTVIIGSTANL